MQKNGILSLLLFNIMLEVVYCCSLSLFGVSILTSISQNKYSDT